jgi:DNA-binding MarR family transcriptional regulator
VAHHAQLRFDPIDEARRQWRAHGWGPSAAGMAAVTSVIRAEQIFLARVDEVLRPFHLSFSRYEVLMLLSFSRRGVLPLGKIGARLQVHAASVTNAIDRLERDRLVRRRPHPTDGRGTMAEITAGGRRLAERATGQLNDRVFAALGLSEADIARLFDILRKLRLDAGDFS